MKRKSKTDKDELPARQPTEGDREAITGNELADAVSVYHEACGKPANSEGVRAVLALSRAAVPDAATDLPEMRKMVVEAKQNPGGVEWQTFWDRMTEDQIIELMDAASIARAERDAALAAVERIREAVSGHPGCDRHEEGDVISCGWKSAYASVVAALDGAPEPEWEYGIQDTSEGNVAFGVREETARLNQGMFQGVRRRKAGPWLPVEGESK